MQKYPENKSESAAEQCQNDVFAVDVTRDLFIREPENFYGRYLPSAFGNVYICKIVKNNKRQQACANDNKNNDGYQTFKHFVEVISHIEEFRKSENIIRSDYLGTGRLYISSVTEYSPNGLISGSASHRGLILFGRCVNITVQIVFRYTADRELVCIHSVGTNGYLISDRDTEFIRQFFGDNNAVRRREINLFMCDTVSEHDKIIQFFGIFGNDQIYSERRIIGFQVCALLININIFAEVIGKRLVQSSIFIGR